MNLKNGRKINLANYFKKNNYLNKIKILLKMKKNEFQKYKIKLKLKNGRNINSKINLN